MAKKAEKKVAAAAVKGVDMNGPCGVVNVPKSQVETRKAQGWKEYKGVDPSAPKKTATQQGQTTIPDATA